MLLHGHLEAISRWRNRGEQVKALRTTTGGVVPSHLAQVGMVLDYNRGQSLLSSISLSSRTKGSSAARVLK